MDEPAWSLGGRAGGGTIRIGILSRNSKLYSIRRLKRAASLQGHEVQFINLLRCSAYVDAGDHKVLYGNREVGPLEVLLPRIGTTVTQYGVTIVRHFEHSGVRVVNGSQAILNSRDKFHCLQLLAKQNVPVPRTILCRTTEDAVTAIANVGGPPVILKFLSGTQGIGVIIAESRESAESMLEALWHLGQEIQIQKFISESKGTDLRALVIGGEVVAAMRRSAVGGSFRSNIHRGAGGRSVELTEEEAGIAIAAAEGVGLKIAGVDMVESNSGPLVIEVNSSPGFEGLERATNRDIAGEIIAYAAAFGDE